jgi:ABC-2 type transport system permease protein
MNLRAIAAIYSVRDGPDLPHAGQVLVSPVLTTSLYFVVFGAAIGSRIDQVEGVSYGAFIVPGLIMLTVLTQAITNASFGIYFPKFIGTIYELLSAPVSFLEVVRRATSGGGDQGADDRADHPGTSFFFVDIEIAHPVWMAGLPGPDLPQFALFGFIIGIWAQNFEQLQLVPLLVITPLVFLGGAFYSISMLPPVWQTVSLFNPVVYLISGFRWSFYGTADINIGISLMMISVFMLICLGIIGWTFKTGYKIKT